MASSTLLARQAIYDANNAVYAYELLFRTAGNDEANVRYGDEATAAVLLDAFSALSVEDVLEGKPAFINFTRRLLDQPPPIDPSRLIVEVLEDVPINDDTIAALQLLKKAGYTIALDDYLYEEGHEELLELADIVKVDVLNTPAAEVDAMIRRFQRYDIKLLAEKVESMEMFESCVQRGFHFFQGYYHSRPTLVKGRRLAGSQLSTISLLVALRNPTVALHELEDIIQKDAVLALKVVQLVDSAAMNMGQPIRSISRAIALLGVEKIRSLSVLLVLSNFEGKLPQLFTSSLLRARLGALLAEKTRPHFIDPDEQFTIGLFSNLDAYLDVPLQEILARTPLAEAIKEAILHRAGVGGLILDVAIALDNATPDRIDWLRLMELGIDPSLLSNLYTQSLTWVSHELDQLG